MRRGLLREPTSCRQETRLLELLFLVSPSFSKSQAWPRAPSESINPAERTHASSPAAQAAYKSAPQHLLARLFVCLHAVALTGKRIC